MNKITLTPKIVLSKCAGLGHSDVAINLTHSSETDSAHICVSTFTAGSSSTGFYSMTPTEMLLLADQLTAMALQIEARTTQRELQPMILEAA